MHVFVVTRILVKYASIYYKKKMILIDFPLGQNKKNICPNKNKNCPGDAFLTNVSMNDGLPC